MARAAKELLLEAVPSLEKNHGLLMEMLVRPDDFTLGRLGCSVREFLEKNGVDVAQDPQQMKLGAMVQELPPSLQ